VLTKRLAATPSHVLVLRLGFFTWIIVVATVAGAAAPFVIGSEKSSQVSNRLH
jgi:hypothetical protein